MTTFFTGIPGLNDSGTALGKTRNNLCTTTEHHQDHRLSCCQQFLNILFLLAWQTESLTVAVLTTQHHILANSSNDNIGRVGHSKGFFLVGFLASIHLTMQKRILP